jgi:hypothetical protein
MQSVASTQRPPLSESFWLGRDECNLLHYEVTLILLIYNVLAPGLSAHVDMESELQGEGSLVSCWAVPERSQSSATRGGIRVWLSTCRNTQHRVLDENDLVSLNQPEFELQEIMGGEDELCGEWMIPS